MHRLIRKGFTGRGGARRLRPLFRLIIGGILLQASVGGCQDAVSNFIDAMGQPVATGIGEGLSDLFQVLIIGVFI